MTAHEPPPTAADAMHLHVPRPNWTQCCVTALRARREAGITIGEIVAQNASGAVASGHVRPAIESAMRDLVEIGVAHQDQVRFYWWRHAPRNRRTP